MGQRLNPDINSHKPRRQYHIASYPREHPHRYIKRSIQSVYIKCALYVVINSSTLGEAAGFGV